MKQNSWFVRGIAAIAATVLCAGSLAGCSLHSPFQPRRWGDCGGDGALAGATAGTISGLVIANNVGDRNTTAKVLSGIGGAMLGAVVGGFIGHEICDPVVSPPPAAPTPAPPPPTPPVTPKKEKIVLRGVHFDYKRYNIRPNDEATLNEAAATLSKHPDVTVHVDGYCDAIGGVKYNLSLSEKRARAVAEYLERKGIPASRLIPRGFGKTHFVAPNDTEEGRAQNRRVELVPVQ